MVVALLLPAAAGGCGSGEIPDGCDQQRDVAGRIVNYYAVFVKTPDIPTYPGPIETKLPCDDDNLDQIRIVRDYGVDKILSYAELETAVEKVAAPPLWHRIGEARSGEPLRICYQATDAKYRYFVVEAYSSLVDATSVEGVGLIRVTASQADEEQQPCPV
jgi:hypothetical protein